MKRFTAATVFAGFGIAVLVGCNIIKLFLTVPAALDPLTPVSRNPDTVAFKGDPRAADLVAFMNDNASRVKAVQAVQSGDDGYRQGGNELPLWPRCDDRLL